VGCQEQPERSLLLQGPCGLVFKGRQVLVWRRGGRLKEILGVAAAERQAQLIELEVMSDLASRGALCEDIVASCNAELVVANAGTSSSSERG